MESLSIPISALAEKTEEYIRTTLQLNKLKLVEKTAETSSLAISKLILVLIIGTSVASASIAAAFWLGDIYGKTFMGFLIVAGFYLLFALIYLAAQNYIQRKINFAIIKQILNKP
jgi:hypothetical protein